MRRILNLNQPGIIFVKVIGLFVLAIPITLYGILLLLSNVEAISGVLLGTIKVSLAIGAFTTFVLLVLIVAEQIQDHHIDAQYQKNRPRKIQLVDGNYECQNCGNQRVKEYNKVCQICGNDLEKPGRENAGA